ncbi:MAG: HypC/HybG/HupF family hydrogenase formation chaperone [Bacteroidota bacterium]
MCLSIPAKIKSVEGKKAIVSVGGNEYRADISLVPDAVAGDYILLHAGFGIQKIRKDDAQITLGLLKEINKKDR